ncbi:hypothetical protein Bbelb_365830 [Branchiostoma belcheri]|nr:hypothetical protein Bbelb_365830 [Branchiostoma belcheri]
MASFPVTEPEMGSREVNRRSLPDLCRITWQFVKGNRQSSVKAREDDTPAEELNLQLEEERPLQNELRRNAGARCADHGDGKATEEHRDAPDNPVGDRADPGPSRLARRPPVPGIAVGIRFFDKFWAEKELILDH